MFLKIQIFFYHNKKNSTHACLCVCACSEHTYNHKHVHYMLHRVCIRLILPTQRCRPRGAADAGALRPVTPCTAVKGAGATRVPLLEDS